ncbi:hypothetical protein [Achromobacter xylosoxidans]|uniref:hypothetical protein n=1 Tax=Alcaligenes xylosoxydans xylosoxydans TaxID=85698 RepID=UPI000668DE84|nr:hypothetical protein [Achromobacter xylosoxidans]
MKTIRLIAFALAAGVTAGPALAAPAVMLNNALITQISKADKPAFHQAVADALNNAADGQSINWSSTPKRKAAPITAKITPLQTSKLSGDRTCRLLEGDFARTSTTETWKFWFCKQPDGTWKASSN